MQEKIIKIRNELNNIGKQHSSFFYGGYFPIFLGLIICTCYTANLAILGLLICSLAGSFILLCYKDTTPLIPIVFMVVLNFRDYSIMAKVWGYLPLLPVIFSFVAHFFLYPIKKFRYGVLVLPFAVITVTFITSGAFVAGYRLFKGLAPTLALGPVMLLIYLFFLHTIKTPKDFDLKRYFCYCLIISALAMIATVVVARITADSLPELGWANINTVAGFLCLAVPACYYLMIGAKKVAPFLCVLAIFYGSFIIITSDAVFALLVLTAPILLLITYRNLHRKHKKAIYIFLYIGILAVSAVALYILHDKGIKYILAKASKIFSDNGRIPLYEEAIALFCKNPLFGVGAGYVNYDTELITNGVRIYNFHSTFFHVLGTMGLFGLVAYGYYFFKRFKLLTSKFTVFNLYVLFGFILFECYGMVDTCEFNAIPLMCAVTIMLTIVERTNKGTDYPPLPLSLNRKNGYNF